MKRRALGVGRRRKQVFVAPRAESEEERALTAEPSPWVLGRYVVIPLEHWEVILGLAEEVDAVRGAQLRRYSYTANEGILPSAAELASMRELLSLLQATLRERPALVPEATEEFPENFPNEEHVRMVEALVAVLGEVERLGEGFVGDVE